MSVAACDLINLRLREAGFTVHEAPSWRTRGNGQISAYEGGLVHHTASSYDVALPGHGIYNVLVNGRVGLAGPLCNYAGNSDGTFTVIAAGPANHAGASGGRSMGSLPVTTSFNRRVLGLEIVYPGDKPMFWVQEHAALAWAGIVADVVGGKDIERVRAHAETSVTGKWDPGYAPGKTIDMAAFRAAARDGVQDMQADERGWLADVHMLLVSGARREFQLNRDLGTVRDDAVKATASVQADVARVATSQLALADNHVTLDNKLTVLTDKVDQLTTGGVDLDVLAAKVAERLTSLRFEAQP